MTSSPTRTPATEALKAAYSPDSFRSAGHQLIDQLADYLEKALSGGTGGMPVLPPVPPDAMRDAWPDNFDSQPSQTWESLIKSVLEQSNHLHHPRYIGHQVSAPLPQAALCDLVAALLNNGTAIYEMGPVSTIMERHVVRWMAAQVGYFPEQAAGFLTSGGTVGNLTALLAARQSFLERHPDLPEPDSRFAVMVSEQAHYSVKRAVKIMGWGEAGFIPLPVDSGFKVDPGRMAEAYQHATETGRTVIAVVANACSTQTGSYDLISPMADFCEAHGLWLHVDGAHGASALLSEAHRHKLHGLHRADSVVWDAHKMMMMPALVTAVLFRNAHHSYTAFSQKASYLFQGEADEEWFNLAHRTMECTKRMLGLKLYAALATCGTRLFSDYIEQTHRATLDIARMLGDSPDFDVPVEPESNILCFRYRPSPEGLPKTESDALQQHIRDTLLASGEFYIVQTDLPTGRHLRCTVMNPFTTAEHFAALIRRIRQIGSDWLQTA